MGASLTPLPVLIDILHPLLRPLPSTPAGIRGSQACLGGQPLKVCMSPKFPTCPTHHVVGTWPLAWGPSLSPSQACPTLGSEEAERFRVQTCSATCGLGSRARSHPLPASVALTTKVEIMTDFIAQVGPCKMGGC